MAKSITQEFQFEDKESERFTNKRPVVVVIKKVNRKEIESHIKFASKLQEEYVRFVEIGQNRSIEWTMHSHPTRNIINDKRFRLEFSKTKTTKVLQENRVKLALVSWNIRSSYSKGRGFSWEAWNILPTKTKEEIEKRVLEMNPSWIGETDIFIDQMTKKLGLESNESSFADLSINPQSVFAKNKPKIMSMMKEINQFVFENNGTIEIDADLRDIEIRGVPYSAENIILRLNNWHPNGKIFLRGYIGVIEHGQYEIKIVTKRDKSYSQDHEIGELIYGLKRAIEWWKDYGSYTEEEVEAMEAYKGDAEAKATYRSLLSEYGLDEDDF